MNKKDMEKVKNRIAFLEKEMESNLEKMKALRDTNRSLLGGITELRLAADNLAPEKKAPEEKEKKVEKK